MSTVEWADFCGFWSGVTFAIGVQLLYGIIRLLKSKGEKTNG